MLRGRKGLWPFVLVWAGIAIGMAIILYTVLWLSGSLHR
jgi:hypothetical protein